jgi:hypothetical protein
MGQGLLVNIDIERGAEVLKALDSANLQVKVALWLFSPDHQDWRMVVASRRLDAVGPGEDYGLINEALDKAGFPLERKPSIMVLRIDDPFIRDLRRLFSKAKSVEGMRLGLQTIGNWFVEDAFVYRIS